MSSIRPASAHVHVLCCTVLDCMLFCMLYCTLYGVLYCMLYCVLYTHRGCGLRIRHRVDFDLVHRLCSNALIFCYYSVMDANTNLLSLHYTHHMAYALSNRRSRRRLGRAQEGGLRMQAVPQAVTDEGLGGGQ